ncbi:MAG: ABC transporter permease, partial [Deltaproteobacteria bacterium]|nr:ABC transporter permease [Deltaproteobacteria bacterium]
MTTLFASLRIALRALMVNKMRSSLTMLGIIIGVGAVIAMIAVGSGAKKKIADQIASMGSNILIVLSGSSTSGGMRFGAGTIPTLTIDDSKAILAEIPGVSLVAPHISGVAQVIFGNQNWSTLVYGTISDLLEIREWSLNSGRVFTQQDLDGATKVCLLGKTVADNLFGGIDPIGQIIRIKKVPFTVIGVLNPKGQSAWGQDQDDIIFAPLTTAQKRLFGMQFPGMVRVITVQAREPEVMKTVEEQITELLRQRHRIQPSQENDFSVR